jgi:hypothetical protein
MDEHAAKKKNGHFLEWIMNSALCRSTVDDLKKK